MTKRSIIIAVSAGLAVVIAAAAVIIANNRDRKGNGDKITEAVKSNTEYSSDEKKNEADTVGNEPASSIVQGVDEIDIGGDFEEATEEKKAEGDRSKASKTDNGKSTVTAAESAASAASDTKEPTGTTDSKGTEAKGEASAASGEDMTGWTPWK